MTIETPVRRSPRTAPAAPLAGRQPVEILFAVFACAWAVQALESKSDRLRVATLGSVDGLSDLLVVGSALAVVWRPSMLRFGVLAFVSILNFWIEIPEVSNHLYAITLINVGFLLQASIRTFRDRRGGADHGPAVSEDFGATVRLITIGLYVMAAFHKLNAGFFDPEVSCGPYIYTHVGRLFGGFPPLGSAGRQLFIYGALLAEFGIPALLLSRSTRRAGIVVGLLFHLFLGARYPSFSTLAYASYVYFLPPVLVSRWIEAGSRLAIAGIPGKWWFRLGAVGLPLFLLLAYEVGGWRGHRWGWLLVFTILVTAAVVLVMRSRPEDWRRRGAIAPDLWTGRVVPGVLVALLVVQALGPYMGFKTATALAMYSNLRTEQASNHLLIPKGSLQIVDWQDDLVRIRSATVEPYRRFAAEGVSFPLLELRRRLSEDAQAGVSGISMVVEHRGVEHVSAAMETHPVFAAPLENLLVRKLTLFRPVYPNARCSW
jgi:hypothetical protein